MWVCGILVSPLILPSLATTSSRGCNGGKGIEKVEGYTCKLHKPQTFLMEVSKSEEWRNLSKFSKLKTKSFIGVFNSSSLATASYWASCLSISLTSFYALSFNTNWFTRFQVIQYLCKILDMIY